MALNKKYMKLFIFLYTIFSGSNASEDRMMEITIDLNEKEFWQEEIESILNQAFSQSYVQLKLAIRRHGEKDLIEKYCTFILEQTIAAFECMLKKPDVVENVKKALLASTRDALKNNLYIETVIFQRIDQEEFNNIIEAGKRVTDYLSAESYKIEYVISVLGEIKEELSNYFR